MSRKTDLDRRLENYFATLRASPVTRTLQRRLSAWQLFAAVSSSAVAMTAAHAASVISSNGIPSAADPNPGIRAVRLPASSSALPNGIALATKRQSPGRDAGVMQSDAVQQPSINAGGVVPIYSKSNVIQSGEWISIFGQNLANQTATWNGDFPTSLGGTSVSIDGKPAFLWYVSSGQLNVQVPDDTATGTVSVVVTTAAGTASSTVTLGSVAPSLSVLAGPYVAAIIVRNNGTGLYGNGSYDVLGPTGSSLGFPTVGAVPGDLVEIYGVGFGPTNPPVPAGKMFSGTAPITSRITVSINGKQVQPSFAGISSAGLYQINIVVPQGLPMGEVPIVVQVGGLQTQSGVYFSLGAPPPVYYTSGPYYSYFYAAKPRPAAGGSGPGNGEGSGGGFAAVRKRYMPRLEFPPAAQSNGEDA